MVIIEDKHTTRQGICPVSRTKGKKIDTATVKCLLAVSLSEVSEDQYYFCRDQDCPVVYFTEGGGRTIEIQDLREQVYQKEPNNKEVLVCYCFRYTVGNIQAEQAAENDSPIIEAINAGIRAGQCACDWRNPQGDCCLGNVMALKRKLQNNSMTT